MAKPCRLHIGGIPALLLAACSSANDKPERTVREATPAQVDLAGTVVDGGCRHSGTNADGSVQFILTCPQTSRSPDGSWALVHTRSVGAEERYRVYVADAEGREVGDIPNLNDAMPFVLRWSPQPNWFFVNHYLGSSLERLRVFELVDHGLVERSDLLASATRVMVDRYPCLAKVTTVAVSGWRWGRDGRRVVMDAYVRPDTCLEQVGPNDWRPVG